MVRSASPASSSESRSRPASAQDPGSAEFNADDVSVEVLVKHLLAAKQSLSSMTLVLRANDLATHARQMHEEAVVLNAQAGFVRQGISEQLRILRQVRRGMLRARDGGRREFTQLIRTLDSANSKLEQTMAGLRDTIVESAFRPAGEEKKCLMDFVDEKSVDAMRDALKTSLAELQAIQTSFDGDLLRFETDLRNLNKAMTAATSTASPSSSSTHQDMSHLLADLIDQSGAMAEHLASLNRHFDMCVTAVRTTEGGAALARRRAAEVSEDGNGVSISGIIAEQDSHIAELEPMDPRERAEIVQVVMQDAPEVDDVTADIQAMLQRLEYGFGTLKDQADHIKAVYTSTITGFQVLEDLGSRLQSYVDSETEFVDRWENEKDIIFSKLEEMDGLRHFYDGYASAYGSLLLEAERRRSVEDKIQNVWRKAKETVDKLIDTDRKEREHFRQEVGEFLPTDLWVGMNSPHKRWEVMPVDDPIGEGDLSTPTLSKAAVRTARDPPR
ncbi:autophagy-related protein 17 [Lasiosphaeria ovina]|uniref:Autophagy-related protein 17 n=1 Tax=Lasiosphaeria ovina TaxID=92902 RepID=A0AAE0K4Y3_9PEZI|nr:autophagy-related protein 17 [Lasiosphaeria ovina]